MLIQQPLLLIQCAFASPASHEPDIVDIDTRTLDNTLETAGLQFTIHAAARNFYGNTVEDIAIKEFDVISIQWFVHIFTGASLVPASHFGLTTAPADPTVH